MQPKEFKDYISLAGVSIIDVRTREEFMRGHIQGAQNRDISSPSFADDIRGLDRSKKYAVYCASGNRSAAALSYMKREGFPNVCHLEGGIAAWVAEGFPTAI